VTAVGVPQIVPLLVSNVRPAGSEGETEYETTVPPFDVGDTDVICVPLVSVNVFGV
jgi:hypothetical protein